MSSIKSNRKGFIPPPDDLLIDEEIKIQNRVHQREFFIKLRYHFQDLVQSKNRDEFNCRTSILIQSLLDPYDRAYEMPVKFANYISKQALIKEVRCNSEEIEQDGFRMDYFF